MSLSFSDTSNKDGIIQLIEHNLGMPDANISGDTNRMAYFTELVNNWLHIVTHWIHQADGEWNYDDFNHGNFPIETFDFTDDKQDFGISDDGEKSGRVIRMVEIRDASTEEYEAIDYIQDKDLDEDRFNQDSGKPTGFWFSGGSIIFDKPIDTSLYDKFRLTYDRNAHLFTVSDTTAKPGFDEKFHWILVYGPCMVHSENKKELKSIYKSCYKRIFGSDKHNDIGLKRMLQQFYIKRSNMLGANVVQAQEENF